MPARARACLRTRCDVALQVGLEAREHEREAFSQCRSFSTRRCRVEAELTQINGERLTSLFRPRSVALVGVSDKSAFSMIAYGNLAQFGFADRTYLVNRRGTETHGR